MAPKCRKMAPRSFQEPSWPLLVALGPLLGRSWPLLGRSWPLLARSWCVLGRFWPILEPLGAILGRSWGVIGGSWGDLGGPREVKQQRGAAVLACSVAPPRDFLRNYLPSSPLKTLLIDRDVHSGSSTRRPCFAGGGGSRTPCGRSTAAPSPGMFRVQVVPDSFRDVVHDGI